MRARYTDTALVELDAAVSDLIGENPSSATAFADLVDAAVARLLDHPIPHKKQRSRAFAGCTSVDFGT
jgi:hypothetical protein